MAGNMYFNEKNDIFVVAQPDGTFIVNQDNIAWQSWRTYEGEYTEIARFRTFNASWEVKNA